MNYRKVGIGLTILIPLIYLGFIIASYYFFHAQQTVHREPLLPFMGSDSMEYRDLSDNLLSLRTFTLHPGVELETFRTPGYPLFLATIKGVFGNYQVLFVIQTLLTLATAWLIYLMSKRLLSPVASGIIALLYVLEPSVITHTFLGLSDILFNYLLVLCIYLWFFHSRKFFFNTFGAIFIGLILGFATLVRPAGQYLLPCLIIWSVFMFWRKKYPDYSWKQWIVSALMVCIGFFIVVTPWLIRNQNYSGRLSLSSLTDFNLFYYNAPYFLASIRNGNRIEAQNKLIQESGMTVDELKNLKNSGKAHAIASRYIKEHHARYIAFHLVETIPFFITSSVKNTMATYDNIFENDRQLIDQSKNLMGAIRSRSLSEFKKNFDTLEAAVLVERLLWLIILVACLASPFVAKSEHRLSIILLVLLVIYFAIITGPVSYARYRLPAEPFMFLTAVYTFAVLFNRLKHRKHIA